MSMRNDEVQDSITTIRGSIAQMVIEKVHSKEWGELLSSMLNDVSVWSEARCEKASRD